MYTTMVLPTMCSHRYVSVLLNDLKLRRVQRLAHSIGSQQGPAASPSTLLASRARAAVEVQMFGGIEAGPDAFGEASLPRHL